MSTGASLWFMAAVLLALIISIQAFLSTRKQRLLGFILPTASLLTATYNLYRSLYMHNPHPTMQEGFLMTLGLIGFGVTAITWAVCRLMVSRTWIKNNRG